MMHPPIHIESLDLSFPHKVCFEHFTYDIAYGERIAIIGRNGSGKSSLLQIIAGYLAPTNGFINARDNVSIGYVPQIMEDVTHMSGGERLNHALTEALSLHPHLLLLDEPTNHLDQANRKSLLHMLKRYKGTLIVASHDTQLLQGVIDTFWHIDQGEIRIFRGKYDDYMNEIKQKRASIEHELAILKQEKKDMHDKLMQEQVRAAKSRIKGEKSIAQRKWPTIVSKSKALRAEETSGQKKSAIHKRKAALTEALSELYQPQIIVPQFSIKADAIGSETIIQIKNGSVGYAPHLPILSHIELSLSGKERLAILGNNRSGKSTLIKAILNHPDVYRTGDWYAPPKEAIGYLDQHYKTLDPHRSVLETITSFMPHQSSKEVRRFLSDFLFRTNEVVQAPIHTLSGGEKTRLCLAQIAAHTPKILILDEITNNLDRETKAHVIDVLKAYAGSILVISHDTDFLNAMDIQDTFSVESCHGNVQK